MVNRKRCAEMAHFLENLPPHKFDMDITVRREDEKEESILESTDYGSLSYKEILKKHRQALKKGQEFDCKTVGCIAGWTLVHYQIPVKDGISYLAQAGDALGLDDDEADLLFTPPGNSFGSKQELKGAIKQLRRLANGKDIQKNWLEKSHGK